MELDIAGEHVVTDTQGYLRNLAEWSEGFAKEMANHDGLDLYNDHWELIWYFREYYDENQVHPTMHNMVKKFGKKGVGHHEQKKYEDHIYGLFPTDPVHEICKLSGLPMTQPDD